MQPVLRVAVILALLAAICVSACGAPGTADGPPASSPTTSNRYGAPVVTHPVNVSSLVNRPCELLSGSELRQLGLPAEGTQRTVVDIQSCRWSAGNLQVLSLALDGNRDLLADAYRVPWRGVFRPTEIIGFPAVVQKTGRGEFNSCTLTTGLGPRQALTADWAAPGDPRPGNDACEFAVQATTLVIRKLPPQR